MGDLATSVWQFLGGILRRSLWLLPAFLLDPFDLYERYLYPELGWELTMPDWYFLAALAALLSWAAMLTFHEQRVKTLHAIRFDIMDWTAALPSYNRSRKEQPFDMAEVTLEGQLVNQDSSQATLDTLTMRLVSRSWMMHWRTVGEAYPLNKQSSGGANRDIRYETITVEPRSKSRDITKLIGYITLPEDCDPAGRFRAEVTATSILFSRSSVSSCEVSFKDAIEPTLAQRERAIARGILPPDKD